MNPCGPSLTVTEITEFSTLFYIITKKCTKTRTPMSLTDHNRGLKILIKPGFVHSAQVGLDAWATVQLPRFKLTVEN